jgi:hypothetical protein
MTYNPKYYDQDFQQESNKWWCTLSINQMMAFEKKYNLLHHALPSEIAEIYDREILTKS